MFMGLGLFILGLLFDNIYLKIAALLLAAVLNVIAAVKSFQEKKKNK